MPTEPLPAVPSPLSFVILAAGLGTRMRSKKAKVLHAAAGWPLCAYPVAIARGFGGRVVLVAGHQHEDVARSVRARFGEDGIDVVLQEKQLGTGHAVAQARPVLAAVGGRVVILYGDAPLCTESTIRRLIEAQAGRDLSLLTARMPDPHGYGRIIRDGSGRLLRVVEEKDCTDTERRLHEINAGLYVADAEFLWGMIGELSNQNAQSELYLTDLAAMAAARGEVATVEAPVEEILGVNDREELARAERILYRRRASAAMKAGVTMHDPDSVLIGPDVRLGADVELGRGVELHGKVEIADGARIDTGCVLRDVTVAAGAHLKPYCVATESVIGESAELGPFAHLRPGSDVGAGAHVGNFVETKKTRLGAGAKANHLSYLGDADIGARVNVGAGTITCNYDGENKFKTVIEEGAFIGSDSQLVAPVTVGRGAYVGSGTTVVKDVPPGALALSRTEQLNKEGWVEKRKKK
jgi:bifunctional UDP-N-acetylglucosamine pyrophosphorylase/glucosamine-1-phosphate N-acetyltransferase